MRKLPPRAAVDRIHSDSTQLAAEIDIILRQLEDHFGGYPSRASGTENDQGGATEWDPVPLTRVESAAIHDGLGRAHAIDQRIRDLLNVAAGALHETLLITRPWAIQPATKSQWGWCELHQRAGFPKVPAAHYSTVAKRLDHETRLCDRCYRRVSEKGVPPSKADVRHLQRMGHWPPQKKVRP
jgi:hypothetical protein